MIIDHTFRGIKEYNDMLAATQSGGFLCKMEFATYTKKRRFGLSAGATCVRPAWA